MIERLPVTIEHRGDQIGDHERGVGAKTRETGNAKAGKAQGGRSHERTNEPVIGPGESVFSSRKSNTSTHACIMSRDCPGMSMTIYRERPCQACLLGQVRTDDYAGVVACGIRTRVATARGQCPRLGGFISARSNDGIVGCVPAI